MKFKIFIALAIFCVLVNIEAHNSSHRHMCRKKTCEAPKRWSKTACACRCPNDSSSCYYWEEFDRHTCSCYCPYSRHFKGCSNNKRWSYSKCYCECRNQKPEDGCEDGYRWSKSRCKCVEDEAATTSAPLHSYDIAMFNNDSLSSEMHTVFIPGRQTFYPAFINVNGKTEIVGPQNKDVLVAGFSSSYKAELDALININASYITPSPGFNCSFVPKNTKIPSRGQLVTFNNGTNGVGLTTYYSSHYNYTFQAIGMIDISNKTLHYLNMLSFIEETTTVYQKLICKPNDIINTTPGTISPTTTNDPATTNDTATTSPVTTTPVYNVSLDQLNADIDSILVTIEENYMKLQALNETFIGELNNLINDPSIPTEDVPVLQYIIDILKDLSKLNEAYPPPARKKRQTTVNCQDVVNIFAKLSFKLDEFDKLKLFLDKLPSRLLEVYLANLHITLPLNAAELLQLFNTYYSALKKNFEILRKSGKQLAQICDFINPPVACALWTRYNGDDAPSVNGFSAGISRLSNTALYVGRGMYDGLRMAASIQITDTTVDTGPRSAGGYIALGTETKIPYAEYLVVPDGCACQWLSPSVAAYRALVLTGDPTYGFAVGRKTFADGRLGLTNVVSFSKRSDYMLQSYNPTPFTLVAGEPASELLVCDTIASTAARPKVSFSASSEACGMWSTIGWKNTAATNGFAAGPSILTTATFKSNSYVGRGQKYNYIIPGRYQVEDPAGTFTSTGGNYAPVEYGSEFLIVPQGCVCSWMGPADANSRKGLITTPDPTFNFLVGRTIFSNGLVSVTHVNFKSSTKPIFLQWYANLDLTETEDYATVVLVCVVTTTADYYY